MYYCLTFARHRHARLPQLYSTDMKPFSRFIYQFFALKSYPRDSFHCVFITENVTRSQDASVCTPLPVQ